MNQEQLLAEAYEQEKKVMNAEITRSNVVSLSGLFSNQQKQNLIEWELDFKSELEDIMRLLRADVLMMDKDNNEYWMPNPNPDQRFFNELGVNDSLRNIVIIVNKNKALSNYSPEEINLRVKQMKHELRVLIYNNYELYGLDNDYKMNNYSMIVIGVGSIIEDVYRRAMNGETHKGLAEQRIVSQNDPMGNNPNQPQRNLNKKVKWYNPFSWVG